MIHPPSFPALMYGLLLISGGLAVYVGAVIAAFIRIFVDPEGRSVGFLERVIWYTGIPVIAGLLLALYDLFVLLPRKRVRRGVRVRAPESLDVTVVLTAFNDEVSIGYSVEDFKTHHRVLRVVVVDNNSTDRTSAVARAAGAEVVTETQPGYGRCVFRALTEGLKYPDTSMTLLCEGDMTFRAYDIDKFLAYAPHADIVNGTRIVEQLRALKTQLTTFMYYGNFAVGKLLEVKHIGKGTFTDIGTTYKLIHNEALRRLLPVLNPAINLEFNAHLLDTGLARGFEIVECPITFHERYGESKGGNVDNTRALWVGARMIQGILFGWKRMK